MVLSFVYVTQTEAQLFISKKKLNYIETADLKTSGVVVKVYDTVLNFLKNLTVYTILS